MSPKAPTKCLPASPGLFVPKGVINERFSRQFTPSFFIAGEWCKRCFPNRWSTFQATVSKEIKTIKWPAAMPEVAEKVCELFDVKFPDLFLVSWKKTDELRRLLSDSK